MGHRDDSSSTPGWGPQAGLKHPAGPTHLAAGLVLAVALAISSPSRASSPVENCVDCHGVDGIAAEEDIPHLNGQPAELLSDMINSYREGLRPPKVPIHRGVRAEHVESIAAHYAKQKAQRPRQSVRPELVARGEALHWKHCADCHMDNGRESDKGAPLTAAQNLEYLIAQSHAFKSGARSLPPLTDQIFRELTLDDLVAIAHFFAAQDQHGQKDSRRRRR